MSVKDNIFSTNKSFHLAFNKTMEALKDDDVSLIAVWGMAGVGKTTLVKEVEDRAREINLFDQVINVVVSETPNLKKIQDGIAYFLEFKIKNTGISRAEQLRHRVKNEERILIILDGVWDVLNLKDIGIPYGEDHKGCKILLTTCCKQVCISMGIKNVIRLDILSDDEAFILFKMKAGDLSSPTFADEAIEIAKGCQGLPLAIVELGTRLSGKDLSMWKITSLRLRSPRFVDGECFGAIKRTYQCLQLSYSLLEEKSKSCFLLCSLFSQDNVIDVEVLTRYTWGLGLYAGIDSIKKVRLEVVASIEILKSSCLLLDHGEMSVKMHNLLHHCALWIASQEKNSFMIGPKIGLKEWQKVEDLPERFVGEELEILSLDENGCSTISSALMEGMESLKVFALRNGHLSTCALENLTNLRTLHLVCCQLDNISSMGKLEKLEILSFRGSNISELPDEIGGLNYLRLLDLLDCQKLQKVPLNLIRKLSHLEELYFNFRSFEEWWVEETSIEGSKARLPEPSRMIPPYSFPPNLKTYVITINEDGSFNNHHNPMSRILSITAIPGALFPTDECLHLIHVMEKQPAAGKSAKELRVEDYDKPQVEFQNVVTSQENNPMLILSNLTLELIEPPQLSCRCNRRTDHVSIERLKIVIVKNCQKLTSLFSFVLAGGMISLETLVIDGCYSLKQIITDGPLSFPSLTTLEITDCNMLKYVFQTTKASFPPQSMVLNTSPQLNGVVEVGNKHIQLPQLQRLALRRLKSLTTFWSGEFCIELPSLEDLEVEACPQLRICEIIECYKVKNLCLFNVRNKLCEDMIQIQGGYFLSCLKKLELKELLDLEVIWKDPSQIVTLQNLTHLKVFRCNKLKNVFSVLLARNLPQLSHLEVQRCKELEQVISQDKISSSMARHKPVYFPNLKEICIMKCNNLKYLFPVSVSRLLKLKKLEVNDASNLREIFRQDSEADMTNDEKLTEILLPKLEELFLEKLPNLIWFTTVGYYFVFPVLTSLKVYACPRTIMKFSFHDEGYVRAEIEKSLLPKGGNVDSSITTQNIASDDYKNIEWHRPSKEPVNNEVVKDKRVIGKHVAGPKDLVINSEKEVKSLKKPSPKLLINESNTMDALVKYANQALPTGQTIHVSIEELFPYPRDAYVCQQHIWHITSFEQIEVTCILIYMSILYRRLKEQNLIQMYGFIDPSTISHNTGNFATRAEGVACALERALPGQLFFAPYNSGNHWQLIVIDPYNDTVYFFDSISGDPKLETKEIIENGSKLFNTQKKRNGRENTWKTINGPRQSGGHECGYYVMRYMKDIIEDGILSISDKEEYTKDELDEVRMEWSDYVSSILVGGQEEYTKDD